MDHPSENQLVARYTEALFQWKIKGGGRCYCMGFKEKAALKEVFEEENVLYCLQLTQPSHGKRITDFSEVMIFPLH